MIIENIPKHPGCYIFRSKHQDIIYIGKSKSLYHRVKQYFYSTNATEYSKYADLAREAHEVETIVTDTETNALILECQLIKKHQPKYNSQLKKSNPYPYIRIDLKQIYPTITISGTKLDDGGKYFGSFYSNDDALSAIELISGIWQTPSCCKDGFATNSRPCLNYHIGRCCAPCGEMIDGETYSQKIDEIMKCLNGNFRHTLSRLNREMQTASKSLKFEKAAKLRDSISGLNRLKKKQKRLYTDMRGKDVYLFFRAFNETCFSLFFIRNGIILDRADAPNLQAPDEFFEAFVHDNSQGVASVENGEFLTTCLLDIGANKYFVPVSSRAGVPQIIRKLRKACNDFIDI